jgi:putative ABC transport system permease protein
VSEGVWSSDALVAAIFRDYVVPASLAVAPDARIIGVTVAVALGCGALFSIAPAWLAGRVEATSLLQQSSRTSTRSGTVGRVLVAGQVALSIVLLTNAGLLVRTLQKAQAIGSGLRTDDVFLASLAPLPGRPAGVDNDTYYPALLERASAVHGVERVAATLVRPAGGSGLTERVSPVASADDRMAIDSLFMPVSPGLFDVLGIHLKGGRDFTWSDNSRARPVAVISETLARRLFPGSAAIGRHVRVGILPRRQDVEIVGIVSDARLYDVKDANVAAAYTPALQEPTNNFKSLAIRGRNVPIEELNRAVGSLGRERVRFARSLGYVADRALLRERILATLAAAFGGLALILVSIGLYGLMAYAVAQRPREISIRMALGADAALIVRNVVREGVQIAAIGVAVGLGAGFMSGRLETSCQPWLSTYLSVRVGAPERFRTECRTQHQPFIGATSRVWTL